MKYIVQFDEKTVSEHTSDRGAKNKARELSREGQNAFVFRIVDDRAVEAWEFENGKQTKHQKREAEEVSPEAAAEEVAPTPKRGRETNDDLSEKADADLGSITSDDLQFRQNSNRRKIWDELNYQEAIPVTKLVDKLYGEMENPPANPKAALSMVVKGINFELDHHNIGTIRVKRVGKRNDGGYIIQS